MARMRGEGVVWTRAMEQASGRLTSLQTEATILLDDAQVCVQTVSKHSTKQTFK